MLSNFLGEGVRVGVIPNKEHLPMEHTYIIIRKEMKQKCYCWRNHGMKYGKEIC